jgi:hypothetical protein
MSSRILCNRRILWGSIFMVCITLGLLIIQPVSVMLAESSRQPAQVPAPPALSLKRLQSSSALSTPGAAEVPPTPYTNDAFNPPFVATPEPTATPVVIYIVPSPTVVSIPATPSLTPTVHASPTPLPASPTPSVQPAVTPTAAPLMTPLPSITPSVTTKPALPSPEGP